MLHEALEAGAIVRDVFVAPESAAGEVVSRASAVGIPVHRVTDRVIAALADTTTPQGTVAVVAAPGMALEDIPDTPSLVVVLADVRDPGNAGTLLRSALAAGASAAVFCRGSADPLHPKTVRAAAGSIFHLPIIRGTSVEDAADALSRLGLRLIGADAHAPMPAYSTDLVEPFALFLGNEAWGLPPASRHLLDHSVSIPMPGGSESLNVAVAGSILLFEAVRQRRLSSGCEHDSRGDSET